MGSKRLSTGIRGLDEILYGGFIEGRAYLVRGGPGAGKTTLGLHFLKEGVSRGESVLFITLGETESQIKANAESLGMNLDGVSFLDLSPQSEFFTSEGTYDIFSPAEVEREPIMESIINSVNEHKPRRVFIDSMTQFRYLATDAFQYRKQALAFFRFLSEKGATVLFTSEGSPEAPDDDLQFLADGVINIEKGEQSKTISVSKFRGTDFVSGRHILRIGKGGMRVYPWIPPSESDWEFSLEKIPSGVPELDELLHGGLERGSVTVITGPSGSGKTTLGLQYMKEAAGRGERSVLYTFEENAETIVERSKSINIPVRSMLDNGTLSIAAIEPLRYSLVEFAYMIREEVEKKNTRIVMIDSTSGMSLSIRDSTVSLAESLHAISRYLRSRGVTFLLVSEVYEVTGNMKISEEGISYLADNIIFLRYWEYGGEIHKAIGVLKMRMSDFEKSLRELKITRYGIKVGEPLIDLKGILSGNIELTKHPVGGRYGREEDSPYRTKP